MPLQTFDLFIDQRFNMTESLVKESLVPKPQKFADWSSEKKQLALYKAIKAAQLGRKILNHYFGRLEHVEEKYQAGLVSEADRESERVIFEFLRNNFPGDEFLGEESTALNNTNISGYLPMNTPGKGRWIVDPLDGTTNYIHRFPIFCISIGYEMDGEIQLAVIDAPQVGEVYTAIRGQGAFINGRPIRVSDSQKIGDALLSTGFFGENHSVLEEQLKMFSELVRRCRGIRRPGAAAYDLCMVARGVFDAFWERNLKPWDCAAGSLLVREAGGQVISFRSKEYHPYMNSCLAGNNHIVPVIQKFLEPHLRPDTD